ncbi:MAG: GNAT family N-acetyltransferase [Salibacteraceae bacterium]
MEFVMNPELETIDWNTISKLFQLVNWGIRNPKEIENSFKKSSITCFVKNENEIIGFGRTVDDGKYYALLVDLVIHPNHQQKGIGRTIVNKLTAQLKDYNFVTLTAAPNKEDFYKKIGWLKQKSAFILPKDQKQQDEHCE